MDGELMIDITAPAVVEVSVRNDGKVVWINIDGICRLRACQIETLIIEDRHYGMDTTASESDTGDAGVYP
jgi:hypothetical protein